jgi:hypothetical protein
VTLWQEAAEWVGDQKGKVPVWKLAQKMADEKGIGFNAAREQIREAYRQMEKDEPEAAKNGELAQKIESMARELSLLKRQNKEYHDRFLDEKRFIDEVKSHLSVLPPPPPYKPKKYATLTKEQSVVMLFSDGQIGERVDPEETGGIGGQEGYNFDVFCKRLEYWKDSVIRILQSHRRITPIRKGHLFNLGDNLDGRDIFIGQGARLDCHVVEQIVKGSAVVAEATRDIAANLEELEYDCISGNHGRAGKRGEDITHCSYEYLFFQFLYEKLKNCGNITWRIPKSWWDIVNVQGWNFYLSHGDSIRSYNGVPWYGLERADGKTTMMLQAEDIAYQYFVCGHFHQPLEWDRPIGERIVNGTFSSGNVFAAKDLRSSMRPSQKLFFVHPEHGISARYTIRLDKKSREC